MMLSSKFGSLLFATCCVAAASADVLGDQTSPQAVASERQQRGTAPALDVRIELDASRKPPSIDIDQRFRIVIKNTSDKAMSIFSPDRQEGYYQLAIHFRNLRTGAEAVARKKKIEDPKFFASLASRARSESKLVRIEPHGEFPLTVAFGDFAWGERAWTGVPDPNTSDRFAIRAVLKSHNGRSSGGASTDDPAFWEGEARGSDVVALLVAARMTTPHHYLWNGFPGRAVELMKADRTWINRVDEEQCTPLHHAARFGYLEAVKWLLDNGANNNAIAYNGFTPLHLADDRDTIALLLSRHPDLSIRDRSQNQTPAQRAATELAEARNEAQRRKWRGIVDLYAKADGKEDLLTAVTLGHLARVKELLAASPQFADNFQNESLLRTAAALGHLEICRFLIDKYHVDVNDFDRGAGFPILKGALAHPNVVRLFIEKGVDLQTRITWRGSRSGIWIIGDDATLLHYAAGHGVPETVKLLIDHGVDIFATTHDLAGRRQDQTALDVAAIFGTADNAVAMLEHPRFQHISPERKRLLDRCLVAGAERMGLYPGRSRRARLMEALLKHGADPNATGHGMTAIQTAAEGIWPNGEENQEQKEVVAILVKHGGTLDLFSAVAIGDEKEVTRVLSKKLSSVNARNPGGYPALHLAIAMNYEGVVKRLLDSGCDLEISNRHNDRGEKGGTPLYEAACWGRYAIAKELIARGAKVDATSQKRWTPLHIATATHSTKVARLLLENGAKPDAITADGETPLALARQNRQGDAAEIEAIFADVQNKRDKPTAK
jgi:ankyrin repeat protein